MERNNVLLELTSIIESVLDESDIKINESTKISDIDGWDSLSMIQVVVSVEKNFKIKFQSMEFNSWTKVSDLIDSIMSKL